VVVLLDDAVDVDVELDDDEDGGAPSLEAFPHATAARPKTTNNGR
jgi:hypothetical protein